MTVVTGSFTATGNSSALMPKNKQGGIESFMNVSLSGTWVGTVLLERSFDGGTTWHTYATHTANVEDKVPESEEGVLYRLNCSAYTSGTINYRLSI